MRYAIVFLALSATVACAPAMHSSVVPSRRSSVTPSMREFVALDELTRTRSGDLFTALRLVRPNFLDPGRGTGRAGRPARVDVFVNGMYAGDVDALRGLAPERVASVRFMRRAEGFVMLGAQMRGEAALFVTLLR